MTGSKSAIFHQVAEIFRAVKPSIGGKKLVTGKVVVLSEILQDRLCEKRIFLCFKKHHVPDEAETVSQDEKV